MKQSERCIRGQVRGGSSDRDGSNPISRGAKKLPVPGARAGASDNHAAVKLAASGTRAGGNEHRSASSWSLRSAVQLALLACSAALATSAFAQETLPTGGRIVAGAGTISASGNTMTVTQHTDRMIANWQGFSIGAGHSVDFVQPGASAVALNRVVGQDPSHVLGSLNANGQVFLVNPNGIVIGRGAQVQSGGFVASTLDIANQDFLSGANRFTGTGGAIRNEGDLSGNLVALIAPSVGNDGTIAGDTALAAGTNVLLDFDGDGLLSVEVAASTVATLVENNGLIRADGGIAILTAKGASDALRGVVNNSGTVQARTLANSNGRILLLADMDHGDMNVGGTLDAAAPNGGDGGFIETSAQNVRIADDVHITTQAAAGEQGTWLIDPNDFTIAASGGNTTGNALSNVLAFSHVTISTATQGTPDRNGDIFVNDTVNWSANRLTLEAERNIVINTAMNGSGTAGLRLLYGQGAPALNNAARYIVNAPINLAVDGNFSTQLGSDGTLTDYTIVTALGTAASSNDGTLQGMRGNLTGNYVLGADIDATNTSSWSGGFTPIGGNGDENSRFSGIFDGLGHRIDSFVISRPTTSYVGLFGVTASSAIVRNVGITAGFGGIVAGNGYVGGLVGRNYGTIEDAYSDRAGGASDYVGGLVGYNNGTVRRSYATGGASSFGHVIGGLAGANHGTIENSHASGAVAGGSAIGGLAGQNWGTVSASYATGNVTGAGNAVGGLVGANVNTISHSYATGTVSAGGESVGGLVGSLPSSGQIHYSYASGSVDGTERVGGLVGYSEGGDITDSFALGDVSGTSRVGGLIGLSGSNITRAYAAGRVSGDTFAGALAGRVIGGYVADSFYDLETSGQGAACGSAVGNTCNDTAGLTTQQMKDPFRFIDAGWNFAGTWGKSRSDEHGGYMVLRALSDSEYDYYVRMSDVSFQRTYGEANPALNGAALDGIGAGNVTLSWGGAASAGANAGTYLLSDANMLNPLVSAGTAADYYFDYGSGTLTINRAALVGTVSDVSRSYDGQAFSGGNGISWSGFVAGDDAADLAGMLIYGGAAQGARNAGVYSLTASGLSSGNYDITYVDSALTIDPRVISLAGSRVYDGTTAVEASAFALDNVVNGESLTLTGIGNLGDRYAGTGKSLSLGSLALGDGTGLASNYTLAGGSHFVDVERRAISVTGVAAENKIYDGTTAATLNLGSAGFAGMVAGDDIAVTGGTGVFSDKNVGAGKLVSVSGLTFGGADAGNYTLAAGSATATASITHREIGAVFGITADDKIYDGTTAVTLNTAAASFSGIIAGDILSVAAASGAFSDRNAGIDKTVNIFGVELGGADAGNYVLAGSTWTTTASITPREITAITGITANDKNYDGSTAAALDTRGASFVGAIAGDDLRVASAQGRFASAEPAENATVYIANLTLGGADAGNYALLDDSATATASINRVIVPPLQPEQTSRGNTERVADTLFPVPATHILSDNPALLDVDANAEPASVSPLDSPPAAQCMESNDSSKPHCTDSTPATRD